MNDKYNAGIDKTDTVLNENYGTRKNETSNKDGVVLPQLGDSQETPLKFSMLIISVIGMLTFGSTLKQRNSKK